MLGEYIWGRRRMRKLGNWDTECLATGPCLPTLASQYTLLPLGRHAVSRSKVWHQVAREELARPLLSDLSLEIMLHDAQVFLLECWDCLAHDRVDFGYELIDVRRGAVAMGETHP